MTSQPQSDTKTRVVLIATIAVVFAANLLWMTLDTRPAAWDQGSHLHLAYKYYKALTGPLDDMWMGLLNVESYYPPLYHLSLTPFFATFGFYDDYAIIANSLYLAAMILATYGIGLALYDRRTGLAAALLVACYPFPAFISRNCLIDTALSAWVSAGYYCFARSRNFTNRRFTFFFALCLAAGMLVKWTALFFLAPTVAIGLFAGEKHPWGVMARQAAFYLGLAAITTILPLLVYLLAWAWKIPVLAFSALLAYWLVHGREAAHVSTHKAINLAFIPAISIFMCFPWYAHNLAKMGKGAAQHALKGTVEGDPTSGPDMWLFYFRVAEAQMGLILFLIFLAALAHSLARRKPVPIMLAAWIVVPYLIFTFVNNKDWRYTLPYIPAAALLSAHFLTRIETAAIRRVVAGLAILAGTATYALGGFTTLNPGRITLPVLGEVNLVDGYPPRQENWPIERLLNDIIEQSHPQPGKFLVLRTLTNHQSFHRGAFREVIEAKNLPVDLKIVKNNVGEFTDYFVTKNENIGPHFVVKDVMGKKDRLLNDPALQKTFSLFRSYPLPDGSVGELYRLDVRPARDLPGADDFSIIGEKIAAAFARHPLYAVAGGVNLRVAIIPTDNPDDLYLGRYRSITLAADSATFAKVPIRGLKLVFENVQINIYDLLLNEQLIFFKIERLTPKFTLRFAEIEAFALAKAKPLESVKLEGRNGKLYARARLKPSAGSLTAESQARLIFKPGESVEPEVEFLRVGPLDIPEIFYRRIIDQPLKLTPTPGWPLATEIQSIEFLQDEAVVNRAL